MSAVSTFFLNILGLFGFVPKSLNINFLAVNKHSYVFNNHKLNNYTMELNNNSLGVFEQLNEQFNQVTIVGNYRGGKSTLWSYLSTGRLGSFPSDSSIMVSHTKGAECLPFLMDTQNKKSKILYVDSEGLGSRAIDDVGYDEKLEAAMFMASQVVVLHYHDDLPKQTLLNDLEKIMSWNISLGYLHIVLNKQFEIKNTLHSFKKDLMITKPTLEEFENWTKNEQDYYHTKRLTDIRDAFKSINIWLLPYEHVPVKNIFTSSFQLSSEYRGIVQNFKTKIEQQVENERKLQVEKVFANGQQYLKYMNNVITSNFLLSYF
eukprot:Pgem_evm1s8542